MSTAFNCKKSWHVHSSAARSQKEQAEFEYRERLKREERLIRERERERELEESMKFLGLDKGRAGIHGLKFMYDVPPGLEKVEEKKESEENGEEIPDVPENKKVKEFLDKAPKRGLWMPLGQEVKVMQCWRCKQYGHRAGDRECPLRELGNIQNEAERRVREDPMTAFMTQTQNFDKAAQKREALIQILKDLEKEEKKKKKKKKKHSSDSESDEERKKKKKKKRKHKSDENGEEKDRKKKKRKKHSSDDESDRERKYKKKRKKDKKRRNPKVIKKTDIQEIKIRSYI